MNKLSNPQNRERILAAEKILSEESTTLDKLESAITLLRGVNPKVDKILSPFSKSLSTLKKLQEGEVVELTVEGLPEKTDEQKRKKKALLLLLKHIKLLRNEIDRVKVELEDLKNRTNKPQETTATTAKIFAYAKGPFGIITVLAVIVASALIYSQRGKVPTQLTTTSSPASIQSPAGPVSPSPKFTPTPFPAKKIKIIVFNGKKIPLDQLEVRTGPECTDSPQQAPHYHAKNKVSVKATDGTVLPDPGACGFGKVRQVAIEEVEI